MKNKKAPSEKPVNTALDALRHDRPKNFMRNRFFALVIDFIIIAFICQFVFTLTGTPDWERYLEGQELVRELPKTDPAVIERSNLYNECLVASLVIGFIYEALMLMIFDASIGKFLFGLRVKGVKKGANFLVSKLLLIFRTAIKAVSIICLPAAIVFIIMCLTAFGNAEMRSGFDMFARTKVISVRGD